MTTSPSWRRKSPRAERRFSRPDATNPGTEVERAAPVLDDAGKPVPIRPNHPSPRRAPPTRRPPPPPPWGRPGRPPSGNGVEPVAERDNPARTSRVDSQARQRGIAPQSARLGRSLGRVRQAVGRFAEIRRSGREPVAAGRWRAQHRRPSRLSNSTTARVSARTCSARNEGWGRSRRPSSLRHRFGR